MQELASLAVVAVADFRVVELLAQLGHVVAWNVLFLLEFTSIVGKTTVFAKFTFSEMDYILAHFSFLLECILLLELDSLLCGLETFLLSLSGGLAKLRILLISG